MSGLTSDTGFMPVECIHGETRLRGELLGPTVEGTLPAVLMLPGATGPGKSFRDAMRELAHAGYLVDGIDMYGVEADISSPATTAVHFTRLLKRSEEMRVGEEGVST